jgi:type II secretory pathway pseudopilin PulG
MRSSFARLPGAFSLVEVALSLAIISFAIVAIMGLFPVAMQTARESNRETRAALIARRIVDELQSLPGTNTALVRGPSVTNPGWRITGLDLSILSRLQIPR